jgi:hypothetical protein|tara:strand:- start:29 stop:229 length:201 start_codon:yes stop_codon:yes gene_type:complete
MTTVTINDIDFNTDKMNEEQQELVRLLQQNAIAINMLDHQIQCVRAVGKVKSEELSKLLDATNKKA